jgi:L-lactate dehydrogenase complex protein LldG
MNRKRMSTSKDQILTATRRNRPSVAPLPDLAGQWTSYPDRRAQFIAVLESVGGQALVVRDRSELLQQVQRLPQYAETQKIVSLVPGVDSRNFDWSAVGSPHALDDVDLAILPGEFGVAENAAVWVTDRNVPQRVLYFLCQHLVLVVPADAIVDHMHAAYELLAMQSERRGSTPPAPGFGTFISGPSKTADIEQSLVIGAHGARSLTVFLLEA